MGLLQDRHKKGRVASTWEEPHVGLVSTCFMGAGKSKTARGVPETGRAASKHGSASPSKGGRVWVTGGCKRLSADSGTTRRSTQHQQPVTLGTAARSSGCSGSPAGSARSTRRHRAFLLGQGSRLGVLCDIKPV